MEWSVFTELGTDQPSAEEADALRNVDGLFDVLADYAPAVSTGPSDYSVQLAVEADNPGKAVAFATHLLAHAVRKLSLPRWPIVHIQVQRWDRFEAELGRPVLPEMLGAAEAAELLGVSKQRLTQLRKSGRFPNPMIELAAGPVWDRAAVERFLAEWERQPGRPRVRQAAEASGAENSGERSGRKRRPTVNPATPAQAV